MSNICEKCVKENSCDGRKRWKKIYKEEVCGCTDFEKRKTNADRIRSMTDEELANALAHKADACWNCSSDSLDICKDCWLDWLKQEGE